MEKQKATYKNSTIKQRNTAKKLLSALAILGIVGFGTGYTLGTITEKNNDYKTNEPTTMELINKAKQQNNTAKKDYVSETDLVNATFELQEAFKDLGIDITSKDILYFLSMINIEEITETNIELANKIFKDITFEELKNRSDYVMGELISVQLNTKIEFNLSPFLFNDDDKLIMESIELITSFIDTNVINNDREGLNDIVKEDFIKPMFDINVGYLNNQGRRMKINPTIGLFYVLETYNTNLIINLSNEMLDDNVNQILNDMQNDEITIQGLNDVFNLHNQKTR